MGTIALLGRVVGVASPWFALLAAFNVLGLLDLARPWVRIRMPGFLRDVCPWEVRGGAYRALGVPAFGEFLRRTPLRFMNRRVYLSACHGDLAGVLAQVEAAEAAHFWGGVATLPYLAVAWSQGWWSALTSLLLFNLGVNLYPILHLRSVRARIDAAVGRRTARIGRAAGG